MISNFFLLNSTGDVLIEKHFVGHTKRYICDLFWEEVSKQSNQKDLCPITVTPNYYILHVRRNGLFFITATNQEQPPLLILEFLHKIVDVLLHYFQGSDWKTTPLALRGKGKKLNEQTIRENFTLVYHLLDEMVDGGFPSTTDFNQLTEIITATPGGVTEYSKKMFNMSSSRFKNVLPSSVTSKIPWRRGNVKYVSNEIKIDIIEYVDAVISSNDRLVASKISGKIETNCRLSGLPDLTLNFQNRHVLSNTVKLHRCIRIKRFLNEGVISFIPPDGSFTLLEFSVENNTSLPISVQPKIDLDGPSGKVKVTVSSTSNKQLENVVITIPFPKETVSFGLNASCGKVVPDELSKIVTWTISKFPKEKKPSLNGSVTLPSDFKQSAHPDIKVDFFIKQFSLSGLKVETLAIHGVNYKPFKGVRSKTLAGSYYVRS